MVPALKPLQPLIDATKLRLLQVLSTDELKRSLLPGQRDCLKTRPDGSIIDGHHRIHILRAREVNVDSLRERSILKRSIEMWTSLYRVNGPWPGRKALAARPRDGDWLAEEMEHWQRAGVDAVLSLLTPAEGLELGDEESEATAHGLTFLSLPIPDREVPPSQASLASTLERLEHLLAASQNVVIHCRQGIGRTGLLAACLLTLKGSSAADAVANLSELRGITIPETVQQRQWIDHFAASLTPTR